ncbi:MAG: hypothetical protein FJ276_22600 [Planctomycetes bacterium]|nr:hypothetical protein [Planctomycetota bacterium]
MKWLRVSACLFVVATALLVPMGCGGSNKATDIPVTEKEDLEKLSVGEMDPDEEDGDDGGAAEQD